MILSHEQIITLRCLRGCGTASINKVMERALALNVNDLNLREFYDYLRELVRNKMLPRFKLPDFCELESANYLACRIIEKSRNMGISIVSRFDEDFPKNLKNIKNEYGKSDAPVLLYYKGNLSVTNMLCVAIVGTRKPTKEGVRAGEYFGEELARRGANIVSGLAIGCDSAGHRGALKTGGVTTAFLAHGLDSVYPAENEELAERIVANGGLLMSEYEIGSAVNRYNLVSRDRLQAGLSSATIVIQTEMCGGTMYAVNATLRSHKPLYVIKYGSGVHDKIDGNVYLLREKGGIPLSSSSDLSSLLSLKLIKEEEEEQYAGLLFNPCEL